MKWDRAVGLNPNSGTGNKSFQSRSLLMGDALEYGMDVRAEAVRCFEMDFADKAFWDGLVTVMHQQLNDLKNKEDRPM